MQQLMAASTSVAAEDAGALDLLDTVPLVMRIIREQMRRHRSGLTVPQFRTLCFISSCAGNSLSAVADFIGLSLPAMSRLVDGLVEQGLIERRPCDDDRRHVRLSVTTPGSKALTEARELAQAHLARAMRQLSARERSTVISAMKTLRAVFTPEVGGDDATIAHVSDPTT